MKKDEKDTLKQLIKEQMSGENVYPIERALSIRKAAQIAPEVAKFTALVRNLEETPDDLVDKLNMMIKTSKGLNEQEKADYINALRASSKKHNAAIQEIKMHARSILALVQSRARQR